MWIIHSSVWHTFEQHKRGQIFRYQGVLKSPEMVMNCHSLKFWGSRGLMVVSPTRNPKVESSSLGLSGIVGGGSEGTVLFLRSIPRWGSLEQGAEPPTAPRAPQHKWLPTAVCVFTAVCVHLDGKCGIVTSYSEWPMILLKDDKNSFTSQNVFWQTAFKTEMTQNLQLWFSDFVCSIERMLFT